MAPTNPDGSTLTEREPVLVIVGAGVALLNVLLLVAVAFLKLEPGQTAALFAVPNVLGAFVAAVVTRGKVAPWEPVELPTHAAGQGYDPEAPPAPRGL